LKARIRLAVILYPVPAPLLPSHFFSHFRNMAAASTGEQVHAIVKLLSEKSVADVQQGAKLLRDFVREHGSSGRSELLQWGVVHAVMTLLTEVRQSSCTFVCLLALNVCAGFQRSAQN
jgi:hypothetical protein